jgi:glutathione S-transferase
MSTIILHSAVMSPYGWTAAHVASEKGVSYRLAPVDVASPAHRRLHPFGKMPVLQHGEIIVYETAAIAHYIDRAFAGPDLQPDEPLGQARVLQWISVVNGYVFPVMNRLVKERLGASWGGDPPDEAVIASLLAPLAAQVRLIDEAVRAQPFLVGDRLTIADSFLMPHLHFAAFTPEGAQALTAAPAAQAWLERMRARPSFAQTDPLAAAGRSGGQA